MNWLAHLYLSEPTVESRIGNLLPDFVPVHQWAQFPPPFQEGIQRHRQIDAFTDAHPLVKHHIQHMPSDYKRFGGVLLDMFFDHFLAKDWHRYADVSLWAFADEFHRSVASIESSLPVELQAKLKKLEQHQVLCSYATVDGIETALERMGARLRRPVALGGAIAVLTTNYNIYQQVFDQFFPELQTHVQQHTHRFQTTIL